MTSTEFKVGMDSKRASSKVLRPPGGGTSDIFNLGQRSSSEDVSPSKTTEEEKATFEKAEVDKSPKSMSPDDEKPIISQTEAATSVPSRHVHRNPITGEIVDYSTKSYGRKMAEDEVKNKANKQHKESEDEKDVSSHQVPTSIRVRNPPGGKSSGIF